MGGSNSVNFLKCPDKYVEYLGDLVSIFQFNAHQKLIEKTKNIEGGGQFGLIDAANKFT